MSEHRAFFVIYPDFISGDYPGLFTSQGCCSGDDVACEGVLKYVE